MPGQIFMRAKVFHASATASSILVGARDNLASFFCIQGDICCYSGRMIAAFPRLCAPRLLPRFKIRALGLSFRKKQDIIAVYLVKKESKGFLN